MANHAPTTRRISTLLAIALLLNGVAVSGMTACCCRALPASGDCCCSRAESASGSNRSCCQKAVRSRVSRVQSRKRASDSHKTTGRPACCKGGLSGPGETRRLSSTSNCNCRQNVPVPARPVGTNRSAEKLAIDLVVNLSVATVSRLSAPRQKGKASVESNAVTALDRCVCLCRFAL
jgi:hypothetical protein